MPMSAASTDMWSKAAYHQANGAVLYAHAGLGIQAQALCCCGVNAGIWLLLVHVITSNEDIQCLQGRKWQAQMLTLMQLSNCTDLGCAVPVVFACRFMAHTHAMRAGHDQPAVSALTYF